jgi:hypothetical protein
VRAELGGQFEAEHPMPLPSVLEVVLVQLRELLGA